MENAEYKKNALVTEAMDIVPVYVRLGQANTVRIIHAALGISSESGEVADAAKRFLFYGKEIDRVNMIEEAGDILWYLNILLDAAGSDFGEAMEKNIAKLKARYGEKFSEHQALNRDLVKEREVLEAK